MTRLALRYLTESDLPFADSLRATAGWNQTISDWQRFLALSPRGCLLAECEGKPVATAVTVAYGTELGWIGMMLVHPDFRRRGIARVLMDHSIEILRRAGVRSIKLDATPEGREVYLRIGFKDDYTLTRYEFQYGEKHIASPHLRSVREEDLPSIVSLDQAATGAPREHLLRRLIAESSNALVYVDEDQITGFGIARAGSAADYIGPIVAKELLRAEHLAAALANGRTFCDLPNNAVTAAWAARHNFIPQRTLTRMFLGENVQPAAPETYFAIAAPDLG